MFSELDDLQDIVLSDARKIYSETVLDYAMNPRNAGAMQSYDGFAKINGPCGDTMQIWICVNNDIITGATFLTDGCGPSIASGSMITTMVIGKSVSEAQQISQQDVLTALGRLPEESEHCPLLAADTLKAALNNYTGRIPTSDEGAVF